MFQFYRIENIHDKYYNDFISIYSTSFPVYEQRSHEQQLYAFSSKHYHLFCRISENRLNAFISFWNFDNYVYVEHFAVNSQIRGQSTGTNTLTQFMEETQKMIVLEIDPIVNEISKKRLSFYQKLDFKPCPYKHVHPAYNKTYQPHELLVLSSGSILSSSMYETFKADLNEVVMQSFHACR